MPCFLVSNQPHWPCASCLPATTPASDRSSYLPINLLTPSDSLLTLLQAGNPHQPFHPQRHHLLPSLAAQLQSMNPSVHPALLLSSLLASPMLQSLLQSTPTNSHTPPDLFDFLAPVMKAPQNSAHAQSEAAPSLSQLLSFIPVAQAPPGYGTSFISDTLSPPQSAIVSPPPEYNFPRELSVADSTSSQDCIQKRSISRAPRSTPTDTAAASTHRSNQKIRLSKQERDLLEQIYQECAVPESDVIRKAAKQIGRKYRHIQYWFQNRRRKQRAM